MKGLLQRRQPQHGQQPHGESTTAVSMAAATADVDHYPPHTGAPSSPASHSHIGPASRFNPFHRTRPRAATFSKTTRSTGEDDDGKHVESRRVSVVADELAMAGGDAQRTSAAARMLVSMGLCESDYHTNTEQLPQKNHYRHQSEDYHDNNILNNATRQQANILTGEEYYSDAHSDPGAISADTIFTRHSDSAVDKRRGSSTLTSTSIETPMSSFSALGGPGGGKVLSAMPEMVPDILEDVKEDVTRNVGSGMSQKESAPQQSRKSVVDGVKPAQEPRSTAGGPVADGIGADTKTAPSTSQGADSSMAAEDTTAAGQSTAQFRQVKKYKLSDFIFLRTLGTGSYGRVHLVQSPHNRRYFAVKVMRKATIVERGQAEHVLSERHLLSRIRHPFIMTLWGTFQDSQHLFLCTDFVPGGELFTLLHRVRIFPEAAAKFYAAEIALALDYLHVNNVVYRDLKPENVLIGSDGHIKLVDFGFAKYVPDVTHTLCGTPEYLAPEIINCKPYNKSVDWYAYGIMVYELLAGYTPFAGKNRDKDVMSIYRRIQAGVIQYPEHFTAEAVDLVSHLAIGDVSKRYGNLANGSNDIFYHPWFAYVDWPNLYYKRLEAPLVPTLDRPGDDRNFAMYPETDLSQYGVKGSDPYKELFKDF